MLMARVCTLLLVLVSALPVRAQERPDASEHALRSLRLAQRDARRREGLWLLGFGAASALGGGVAAIAGRRDDAWLAGGVTTASFGAINALLALGLLDLSGARRARILAEDEPVAQTREREARAQLKSAQAFALNTGLDIAYITAGAFLVALGRAHGGHDWERGAGISMIAQSGFLFAFDLSCWLRSNRRAAALAAPRMAP